MSDEAPLEESARAPKKHAMPGASTAFERTDGFEFYEGVDWASRPTTATSAIESPFEVRRSSWFRSQSHLPRRGASVEPCDDDPTECEVCSGEAGSEFHEPAPEESTP
jgi:hypothetical protein